MTSSLPEKPRASQWLQLQTGNKNGRIESLDFLRGIAAFAVMLFHYTATTTIVLSDQNPLRIVGGYGHLGVDVFFILSGLVIPYSMYVSSYQLKVIGKFLLKRTIRLEIPYLILIVLEVIMIYISSWTPWRTTISDRLNAYNILLHVGYLNGVMDKPWLVPVFWTLAIEFQFYLLIALLFPLLLQIKFSNRILVAVGIVLLGFIFPQPYLFFIYGAFFLIGMITFQLMINIIKPSEFFPLTGGLFVLLYFQHGPISCFVAAATLMTILLFKCDWKWGGFLGIISYSLYLIHAPFGGRLLMLTNMFVHSEWIKSILIILYLGVTIFVAWLFFLMVERPSLLLSKKISYKNRTESLTEVSNNA